MSSNSLKFTIVVYQLIIFYPHNYDCELLLIDKNPTSFHFVCAPTLTIIVTIILCIQMDSMKIIRIGISLVRWTTVTTVNRQWQNEEKNVFWFESVVVMMTTTMSTTIQLKKSRPLWYLILALSHLPSSFIAIHNIYANWIYFYCAILLRLRLNNTTDTVCLSICLSVHLPLSLSLSRCVGTTHMHLYFICLCRVGVEKVCLYTMCVTICVRYYGDHGLVHLAVFLFFSSSSHSCSYYFVVVGKLESNQIKQN